MKKWKCTVCGFVHEGDAPPEKCPRCGSPAEKYEAAPDDTPADD